MTSSAVEPRLLQSLIGEWTYELKTADDSDHPEFTSTGTEVVRPVGDVWIVAETTGRDSDGGLSHSIMTLGFEPAKARFAGSFAGTMAPYLFIYDGTAGENGTAVILETEGPAMTKGREVDKYRDIHRFIDADNRQQDSQALGLDGQWRTFMTTRYKRTN